MHKSLTIFFVIGFFLTAQGQLIFDYSNYWWFMNSYNPAAICYQQDIGATALARKQWIGYTGSPFGTEFLADFRSQKVPFQFGLAGGYHSSGFFREFDMRLQSAYRMSFNRSYLQIGAEIGLTNYRIYNANWIAINPADPSIPANNSNSIGLSLGAGVFYSHPNLLISLSSLQINEAKLSEVNINLKRHYSGILGFKIPFGEAGELMPITHLLWNGYAWSHTITLVSTYDNRLSAGIGIRLKNALLFTGSYSSKSFRIGYSFDLATTTIAQYSRGSHEFFFTWYLPVANKE